MYRAYHRRKQWCENPRDDAFRYYGALGILLRFSSFEEFLAEVGDRPGPYYQLVRINADDHFMPGNLAWVEIPRKRKRRN